jgi:hypothetical protein
MTSFHNNAYFTMATLGAFYGYAASIVACVAFGSFAVPIKSEAARRIYVDPLGTFKFTVLVSSPTCSLQGFSLSILYRLERLFFVAS